MFGFETCSPFYPGQEETQEAFQKHFQQMLDLYKEVVSAVLPWQHMVHVLEVYKFEPEKVLLVKIQSPFPFLERRQSGKPDWKREGTAVYRQACPLCV